MLQFDKSFASEEGGQPGLLHALHQQGGPRNQGIAQLNEFGKPTSAFEARVELNIAQGQYRHRFAEPGQRLSCVLDPDPGAGALELNAVGGLCGTDQRDPLEQLQFDAGDPVQLGVAHHGSGTW